MQHFLGPDLDVGGLAAGAAAGLVQHDRGVGQGSPVALGAGREDHGGGSHGLANADGVHRRLDVAEGVGNGEGFGFKADRITRVPAGAGGVDVEEDRLIRIVEFQEQQLGNDQLGHVNAHLTLGVVIAEQGQAQVDDALLEQQGGQIRGRRAHHRGIAVVGG